MTDTTMTIASRPRAGRSSHEGHRRGHPEEHRHGRHAEWTDDEQKFAASCRNSTTSPRWDCRPAVTPWAAGRNPMPRTTARYFMGGAAGLLSFPASVPGIQYSRMARPNHADQHHRAIRAWWAAQGIGGLDPRSHDHARAAAKGACRVRSLFLLCSSSRAVRPMFMGCANII